MFSKTVTKETHKLYKDNVRIYKVGYQTPGSRSLTLMHTVVIGNPRYFHQRVISLSEGVMSLSKLNKQPSTPKKSHFGKERSYLVFIKVFIYEKSYPK